MNGMNSCKIENKDDIEKWCKLCWETVIKNEKFKFKAVKNKSVNSEPNTYTIADLLNDFPAETKFLSNEHLFRIQLGELQTYDNDTHEWRRSINSLKQILEMKFTKVEEPKLKPMTFEEAVRTGKRLKCLKNIYNENIYNGLIEQRDFYSLTVTLKSLYESINNFVYSEGEITDMILKGTWFAEGVYEEE